MTWPCHVILILTKAGTNRFARRQQRIEVMTNLSQIVGL